MDSFTSHIAVSVIVPVFNACLSVEQCVESLLNQIVDFQYEIILIDDGSTDGSAEIMDMMAGLHKKIVVFHQSNAGSSAARNTGLANAKGRYIVFADSDDYVSSYYLKHLYEAINSPKKAQLVIAGFTKCYAQGKRPVSFESKNVILSDTPCFLDDYKLYYWGMPFAKLYDLDIIRNHSILFKENIKYSEDLIFFLTYLQWIDSVKFISCTDYNYRCGNLLSLINSHHSYETEYAGYQELHSALYAYMNRFGIQYNQIPCMHDWVKLFLFRTIKSLYRRKSLSAIGRKTRLLNLKILCENTDVNFYMGRDYYPNILDGAITYLFIRKYIELLDLLLVVFWKLRSMSIVDLYLKRKFRYKNTISLLC